MASTVHEIHPPQNSDEARALYDDCTACDENGTWPFGGLDTERLRILWDQMRRVEFKFGPTAGYRNSAEARAAHNLYWAAVIFAKLEVLPEGWRQHGLIPDGGEAIDLERTP